MQYWNTRTYNQGAVDDLGGASAIANLEHQLRSDQYPLVNYRNYGKWPFLMGKSTISMAIFNSYVSLPEGNSSPLGAIGIFLLRFVKRLRDHCPAMPRPIAPLKKAGVHTRWGIRRSIITRKLCGGH